MIFLSFCVLILELLGVAACVYAATGDFDMWTKIIALGTALMYFYLFQRDLRHLWRGL